MTLRQTAGSCAAAVGAIMAIAAAGHPGIPAYRHDWEWPVQATSFAAWLWSKLDAWSWQNFGQPNIAIQVHPFFALSALAAQIFPSKLILVVWLAAVGAVAAGGAAAFTMGAFEVGACAAMLAGVLYGLAPLVVNKMVAGHLSYLLAYAAVPWLMIAATWRHRAGPWATGLLCAWIGIQIQMLAFALILACTAGGRVVRRSTALPLALAACTLVPYIWALLNHAAVPLTSVMQTSLPWEAAQSARFSDAVLGIGYFAGYWKQANANVIGSMQVPWVYLAGIALAVFIRPDRRAWGMAFCYALGVCIVNGTNGLLGVPLSWLFAHSTPASAFRELYNAAILVSFAGAVGAGIALNAVRTVQVQAIIVIAILSILCAPWIGGGVLGQTASAFPMSSQGTPQPSDRTGVPSRFYLTPGANPVGPLTAKAGGADPRVFRVGAMDPFWVYLVRGQEGAAIWALQGGGSQAATIARAVGIVALFEQPDLETKFGALSTSGRHLSLHEFSGVLPDIPGSTAVDRHEPTSWWAQASGSTVLRLVRVELAAADPASHGDEPLLVGTHGAPIDHAWVPAQDWWFLSDLVAQAAPHGVVTASPHASFSASCARAQSTAILYVAGRGHVGEISAEAETWKKLRVRCGETVSADAAKNGYIVLTTGADIASWSSLKSLGRLADVPLDVSRRGDELVAIAADDCRRCTLVLAEGASPGWLLHGDRRDTPAVATSNGFCSWGVDLKKGQSVRVVYAPSRVAALLEWGSTLAWMCLMVVCGGFIVADRRRRDR